MSEPDGALVLHICGELDLATRSAIEPALLAAIAASPAVVVDLSGLTFCDSTGISMFIAAYETTRRDGGTLSMRNPSAPVLRVFEIAGLDRLLTASA